MKANQTKVSAPMNSKLSISAPAILLLLVTNSFAAGPSTALQLCSSRALGKTGIERSQFLDACQTKEYLTSGDPHEIVTQNCALRVGSPGDGETTDSLIEKCINDSFRDAQDEFDRIERDGKQAIEKRLAVKSRKTLLQNIFVSGINSANGVNLTASVTNPNPKSAIKYLTVSVTPFNAVGDVVRSSIGGISTTSIKVTGPISFEDETKILQWDAIWYNPTINCAKVNSISVEYMNGSRFTFAGTSLQGALGSEVVNTCRTSKN
jgi:hypothetical protein